MAYSELTAALKVYVGEYDFAVDGGAISTIPLRAGAGSQGPIPNGAVILGGYFEVLTAFTTGSAAQAALTAESAADLQAAAVVSGAPYSTLGQKSVVPAFTGAASIKTTAARSPSIVISVGTITAGKLRLVLVYR
jgi:hypothetical protein